MAEQEPSNQYIPSSPEINYVLLRQIIVCNSQRRKIVKSLFASFVCFWRHMMYKAPLSEFLICLEAANPQGQSTCLLSQHVVNTIPILFPSPAEHLSVLLVFLSL